MHVCVWTRTTTNRWQAKRISFSPVAVKLNEDEEGEGDGEEEEDSI